MEGALRFAEPRRTASLLYRFAGGFAGVCWVTLLSKIFAGGLMSEQVKFLKKQKGGRCFSSKPFGANNRRQILCSFLRPFAKSKKQRAAAVFTFRILAAEELRICSQVIYSPLSLADFAASRKFSAVYITRRLNCGSKSGQRLCAVQPELRRREAIRLREFAAPAGREEETE